MGKTVEVALNTESGVHLVAQPIDREGDDGLFLPSRPVKAGEHCKDVASNMLASELGLDVQLIRLVSNTAVAEEQFVVRCVARVTDDMIGQACAGGTIRLVPVEKLPENCAGSCG